MNEKYIQELYFIRGNLQYNLNILVESYDNNLEVIQRKSNELEKKIKDSEEFLPIEHFFEKIRIEKDFSPLLISSFYILSFSLFESSLKKICAVFSDINPNIITLNDIKANGDIDKYRKYLYKVQQIDKAEANSTYWQEILTFKNIRNRITHHHSTLNTQLNSKEKISNSKEYLLLKKYSTEFSEDDYSFKIYDKQFLEDFNKSCMLFIQLIYFDLAIK